MVEDNINVLEETDLSVADLRKPFHDDRAAKYDNRAQKFLEKIFKEEPFEMKDGKKAIILQDMVSDDFIHTMERIAKENDVTSSLGDVDVQYEDGTVKKVRISSFKKTEEFGAGQGSGAGTAQTAEMEQATCDMCNLRFSRTDNLSFNEVAARYPNLSKEWISTFVMTANSLAESSLFNLSNPKFYYHSGPVLEIESKFKEVSKGTGLGINKWNPADIWAMSENFSLNLENVHTLPELNSYLRDNKNNVIGISLKKLGKDVHVLLFDPAENEPNLFKNVDVDFYFGKGGSLNFAFDPNIFTNVKGMVFRTFNSTSNFEGELKGYTAQGGKIAQGSINSYIDRTESKLEPCRQIELDFSKKEGLWKNYMELLEKHSNVVPVRLTDLNIGQQISNYLGLKVFDYYNSLTLDGQQEWLTKVVYHAASRSPLSCPYLKVS